MNKYLVIGSNSFSGSHFVNALLDKNFECFAISRSSHLEDVFCPYAWEKQTKKPTCYQLDINKNNSEIVDLIKKNNINHIVNFAAQSMVAQSWDSPEDWYQTNVIGQVSLLNHLKDFAVLNLNDVNNAFGTSDFNGSSYMALEFDAFYKEEKPFKGNSL